MDQLDVKRIGRYQLLDVIGKGGMGVVYRAVDTTIDRKVAIKMLLGQSEQRDPDLLARFYREVRSTANLQHKNIVTVFGLDDFEGLPYMVMEYLEGQSIAQMISTRQPLTIVEKIGLISQVCEGLQYAHEHNVIHRDVKPANILVLKDGTAKIVDFGIARIGRNDTLTRTGLIVGSINYMSPEQTKGSFDARSDIYSTGVTLFEFLAGQVPFKGPDPQSTMLKIVQEPVPALSRYLAAYPKALDAILGRAMAKDPAERYQTAEDFGYDLSQLHDTLKREITGEFLEQAKQAMQEGDWDSARQRLQEILRFDRRNQPANELYKVVREQIQILQRSQQIEQLRSQAELALAAHQFEEAFELVERAKRLAPTDVNLELLSQSIRGQLEQAHELSEALRRGQAALYAGDLNEATQAVRRALAIDDSNTEACALDRLVQKELEDRTKRAQLQGLLDDARREISARDFVSALQNLEKARVIDPADSNIRELINWAANGYEQEKQRAELRKCTDEIGRMVAEDRYADAVVACKASLQKFPQDGPLGKLYELAKRQLDTSERRRAIDEISVTARTLVDSDRISDAIRLLESSLERFPSDPSLQALLEIARSQEDRNRQVQQERERAVENLAASSSALSSVEKKRNEALGAIAALENALTRRLSVARLAPRAVEVLEFLKQELFDSQESQRASLALDEFDSRVNAFTKASAELKDLARLINEAKDNSEADLLFDRARRILSEHAKEEAFREGFDQISQIMGEIKARREGVRKQISEILRAMQSSQSLAEVQKDDALVRKISKFWAKDELIRNLLEQATMCVQELQKRRATIRSELGQLSDSISTARSLGQLRFLNDQARMLLSEIEDEEISRIGAQLEIDSNQKTAEINRAVATFTELQSEASTANSLEELGRCNKEALNLLRSGLDFEETSELQERIQRTLEDRSKEYRRIWTTLEQLTSSTNSAGTCELDAVVARGRTLLQKFPYDPYFDEVRKALDAAVSKRRDELAAQTVSDQSDEFSASGELQTEGGELHGSVPSRKRIVIVAAAVCAIAIVSVGGYLLTRRTVIIRTTPAGATIRVDEQSCSSPCTLKLRVGNHKLDATSSGFAPVQEVISIPWFGAASPSIAFNPIPTSPSRPEEQASSAPNPGAGNSARVDIRTSVAGASIFVDGSPSPAGKTDQKGQFQFSTTVGSHYVRIEKAGFENSPIQTITARPDEVAVARFDLKPSSGTLLQPFPAPTSQLAAAPKVNTAQLQPQPQPAIEPPAQHVSQPQPAQPVPAPTDTFTVSPETIAPGKSAQLVWATQNAEEVTIDGEKVSPNGSRSVSPTDSRKFTLVAKGPGGTNRDEVFLSVRPDEFPRQPNSKSDLVSDQDKTGIQKTLNRYAEIFAKRKAKSLKEIWPTVPAGTVNTIQSVIDSSKALSLSIVPKKWELHGTGILVTCQQTQSFEKNGKQTSQSSAINFYMVKSQGAWIISDIPLSSD